MTSLSVIRIREATAGLDHAHHKENYQQGVTNSLQPVVDAHDYGPDPAALELLRPGGEQGPDLRQLPVPGPQSGVQVVYDPIAAAHSHRLLPKLKMEGITTPSGYLFAHQPVIKVRISFVKVITMPPAMVRMPFDRWEGSWLWKDRPTWRMP